MSEIVLTGGPCAGKTTALAVLSQKLSDYGYQVLVCPEVASLVINAGVAVGQLAQDPATWLEFQRLVVRTQGALRERFRAIAGLYDDPVVILFDRAEMDNAAYIDPDLFAALLEDEGTPVAHVRDSYDAVIHLVSAADGAEHAYTTENNAARSETPEQARALDRRTLQAWVGHPHLRIIDNSTDFASKVNRTLSAVLQVLGLPAPLEIERKFLLEAAPAPEALERDFGARAVEIEQTYLTSDDPAVELRVRRRSQGAASTYFFTEKRPLSALARYERERRITPLEYQRLLVSADPARSRVVKTRYCFAHDGLYFELDHVRAPRDLWILEVELTEENAEVRLPDGLVVAREVTQDRRFTNAEIARVSP